MGNIEINMDNLKIYNFERPEDKGNWWECDITKEEAQQLKENKLNAYDVINDGREVW